MATSVVNGTVIHGWCGFVEKSPEIVSKLMVLNKLWIPDVLIDIIKDYLYISATEVLRKFYRYNVNKSITSLTTMSSYLIDIYGRQRIAHWSTGHIYGDGDIQFQGLMCVTCGDFASHHNNINGCCALQFDEVDGLLYLVDDDTVPETIPEVAWGIDIPVQQFVYTDAEQAQFMLSALEQAHEDADRERIENYVDYDQETEAADYAEYMREQEMEAYESRR
jgi:hypothetical protein